MRLWKIWVAWGVIIFVLALGATIFESVSTSFWGFHLPFRLNLILGPVAVLYGIILRREHLNGRV